MKFDTTTVSLVIAIAEEGSISRASDRLGLAVAAASKRVSDLEAQLGVKLFKRQPHGVKVTEAGTKLLSHIRQIDNLTQRLVGDAQAVSYGREGRVIIGAPKSAIIPFLAREIAGIQRKYPGIVLQIVEENSRIVQKLLRDKVRKRSPNCASPSVSAILSSKPAGRTKPSSKGSTQARIARPAARPFRRAPAIGRLRPVVLW